MELSWRKQTDFCICRREVQNESIFIPIVTAFNTIRFPFRRQCAFAN